MEYASRLGYFFLVLAFILYLISTQSDVMDPDLRGRLIVFRVVFGLLGLVLVTRYRGRSGESNRFSWIRRFLFRRGGKRGKKSKSRRRNREIGFDNLE